MFTQFHWISNKPVSIVTIDGELLRVLHTCHQAKQMFIKLNYIQNFIPMSKKDFIQHYLNLLTDTLISIQGEQFDYMCFGFVISISNCSVSVLDNYIPSTRENWENLMVDIWNENYFMPDLSYI